MSDYSEAEREEKARKSQEKFVELVEGDIDRGDPCLVVMEDRKHHLTFFGWFPIFATYNPGGMMLCSRDGDKLVDTAGTTKVKAENVEAIYPLQKPDQVSFGETRQ
jgi:hypothetical protein